MAAARGKSAGRAAILELYADGLNYKQIGALLGIDRKKVASVVRRAEKIGFAAPGRDAETVPDVRMTRTETLPPLTDWPKYPGCQCGYCPEFQDIRYDREAGIAGVCRKSRRQCQRSDFCTQDDKPEQAAEYTGAFGHEHELVTIKLQRRYD